MAKKEKIVTDPFGSYTGLVRHPALRLSKRRLAFFDRRGAVCKVFCAIITYNVRSWEIIFYKKGLPAKAALRSVGLVYRRISSTVRSLTLVPVGPVKIRPSAFASAW